MSPSALWGMGIIRCCITAMTQACAQHMVRAGRVNTQVHWGFRWPWGLFSIPPPPWSCGDTWGHPSSQKPQRSYARNNLVIQSGNVFWIKAREGNAFLDLIKSQLFFSMYRSVSQSDESIRGDAQTLFLCCDDQTLRIFLILMNQHASPGTHVLPVVLSHTSKSIELILSTYWLLWSLNENEYCPGCHTMTARDNYSTCVGKHTPLFGVGGD